MLKKQIKLVGGNNNKSCNNKLPNDDEISRIIMFLGYIYLRVRPFTPYLIVILLSVYS